MGGGVIFAGARMICQRFPGADAFLTSTLTRPSQIVCLSDGSGVPVVASPAVALGFLKRCERVSYHHEPSEMPRIGPLFAIPKACTHPRIWHQDGRNPWRRGAQLIIRLPIDRGASGKGVAFQRRQPLERLASMDATSQRVS